MNEQDTVKLLKECDAGIKMGLDSINEMMDYVSDHRLKDSLNESKERHEKLQSELHQLLKDRGDVGKDPSMMAKSMSHLKTNVKLVLNESDHTIADLITDGCNMGVKSLNRYLNQYEAADEVSKDIAKRLINLEEKLAVDIRAYL